ncbi:MAG TPA: hypothetical protein VIF12_06805, partial [Micavibrio sp.]
MIAKEQETLDIYKNLMEEVKMRIDAVATMFQKQIIPEPLIQEFCFLQVRMICELIALACLIAHGTIIAPDAKKIQKQHKPADIMQQLNDINPDFYPHPLKSTRTSPTSIHYEDINKKFMTKQELLKLWGKCGDALHRGDVRKIMKKNIPLQRDFPDLEDSRDKIMNLLGVH